MKPLKVIVLCLLSLWFIYTCLVFQPEHAPEINTLPQASHETVETLTRKQEESLSESVPILAQVQALATGRETKHQFIRENPNDYYLRGNTSEAYGRRLRRHNQIAQYYYSPIRDHPSMQQLMVMLLEEGYDVMDWVHTVLTLTSYHAPIVIERHKLETAGFFPEEIEQELQRLKKDRSHRMRGILEDFRIHSGITDTDLIERILALEFPLDPESGTMLGRHNLQWGERLLTDKDWMDTDFRQARQRAQASK